MPHLKQIKCQIEFSSKNIPLTEYGTAYHDGVVETFIACLEKSEPFSIHLTSHGYIAPGLAMFVFIDGISQCNRNRRGLVIPDVSTSPSKTDVDFRVRQKEEKFQDNFIGREWTFAELNTVAADKVGEASRDTFNNIGTIEVVVLRCTDQSRPLGKSSKDVTKQVTNKETSRDKTSDSGMFGLAGLFDGVNDAKDERQASIFPFGLDGADDTWPQNSPASKDGWKQTPLAGLDDAFKRHGLQGHSGQKADDSNDVAGANAQRPAPGPQFWNYANANPYMYPPPWGYPPWAGMPHQHPGPQAGQWPPIWPGVEASENKKEDKPKRNAQANSPASKWGSDNGKDWRNGNDNDNEAAEDAKGWGSPAKSGADGDGWNDSSKGKEEDNTGWKTDEKGSRGQWNGGGDGAGGDDQWDFNKNDDWNQANENATGGDDPWADTSKPQNNDNDKSWSNNDIKAEQSKKKASKKLRSHDKKLAEPGEAVLDPSRPHIKPYWSQWNRRTNAASASTDSPSRRSPYILPAEPLYPVDNEVAQQRRLDYQVRAGKGKLYAHSTSMPRYIDSMREPYAVFVFKYRSKLALEDHFPNAKIKKNKIPMQERMKDMSREELMEYTLRIRKIAGSEADATDSEESDNQTTNSKLSNRSSKSKKSAKKGQSQNGNTGWARSGATEEREWW